jgi:tetratricopeptide (TPR) repeat protein
VIVATGGTASPLAAKAATTTIPIVFATAADPVQLGLVASLGSPGGNVTGISMMNVELGAKQAGLLHELLPRAGRFAVLVNPSNVATAEPTVRDVAIVGRALSLDIQVYNASTRGELDAAFAAYNKALKLTPSYQAHNNLGVVFYYTGRFEAAAREYQAALDVGGPQVEPLGGLADSLRQQGMREKARAPYEQAIALARERLKIDPEDPELRTGLAMLLAGAGRCREAREQAGGDARRERGLSPSAHSYAAVAYAICGDHEAAVRAGGQALDGGALTDVRSNPDLSRVRDDPRIGNRLRAAPDGL